MRPRLRLAAPPLLAGLDLSSGAVTPWTVAIAAQGHEGTRAHGHEAPCSGQRWSRGSRCQQARRVGCGVKWSKAWRKASCSAANEAPSRGAREEGGGHLEAGSKTALVALMLRILQAVLCSPVLMRLPRATPKQELVYHANQAAVAASANLVPRAIQRCGRHNAAG